MIGTPARPPKPRKNAPGRITGDIQVKRPRHPIVKKWKILLVLRKYLLNSKHFANK